MSAGEYSHAVHCDIRLPSSTNLGAVECKYERNANNIQIWNNAAFDDEESTVGISWLRSGFFGSSPSKENHSPNVCLSPEHHEAHVSNFSASKPLRSFVPVSDVSIDDEIEQMEKEMARLAQRLEALRAEKGRRNPAIGLMEDSTVKAERRQGKMVGVRAVDVNPVRRGLSLCPAEIAGTLRSRPREVLQGRRKSCFLKVSEITEEGTRGCRAGPGKKWSSLKNSRTISPRSQTSKICDPRNGISTIATKKLSKKDDLRLQPKKLFADKLGAQVKPTKNARVVASRYNQIIINPSRPSENSPDKQRTKCCPPENGKNQSKKTFCTVTPGSERGAVTDCGLRRRWEIPEGPSLWCDSKALPVLPKIRAVRCTEESPRDSGCAKRVADLVGKKSYFTVDDGDTASSTDHLLGFEEDD